MDELDPHDVRRYQRELAQCPMFPELIRPPRTRREAEARREAMRRQWRAVRERVESDALATATRLLLECQRRGVPGSDVWRALRPTSHIDSHSYTADALLRLLRVRGVEV